MKIDTTSPLLMDPAPGWNEQAWLADRMAWQVQTGYLDGIEIEPLTKAAGEVSLGYLAALYDDARDQRHREALLDNCAWHAERYLLRRPKNCEAWTKAREAYGRACYVPEQEN